MSSRNSPEMIFDLMGFGRDPSHFDPRGVEVHGGASFAGSLRRLAEALALPLDDVVATGQVAVARHADDVAAAGSRRAPSRRSGWRSRHARRPAAAHVQRQLVPDRPTSTRPGTCGRPAGTSSSRATPRWTSTSASPCPPTSGRPPPRGLTAHRPVNAVPYVCAAAARHPHHRRPAADHRPARLMAVADRVASSP